MTGEAREHSGHIARLDRAAAEIEGFQALETLQCLEQTRPPAAGLLPLTSPQPCSESVFRFAVPGWRINSAIPTPPSSQP